MRLLVVLYLLFFTLSSFAQEEVVQVGKHVTATTASSTMIISLLMVVGLIVACAMVLKKFQVTQQNVSGLKIVTSLSLGTKERIVVVQVADKQLLLGVTAQQITVLDHLEKPLDLGKNVPTDLGKSFTSLLKNTTTKKQA
ncbi:MAG: flagellar protein FliO/FliZ [Alteromonadaceae bacterium]|jgi:flagellar protein FliO/FliZ